VLFCLLCRAVDCARQHLMCIARSNWRARVEISPPPPMSAMLVRKISMSRKFDVRVLLYMQHMCRRVRWRYGSAPLMAMRVLLFCVLCVLLFVTWSSGWPHTMHANPATGSLRRCVTSMTHHTPNVVLLCSCHVLPGGSSGDLVWPP
jgi:hypothetical protein